MMCKNAPEYCSGRATEASGYCFMCAEEMAYLLHDVALECGDTKENAAALARTAWKESTS